MGPIGAGPINYQVDVQRVIARVLDLCFEDFEARHAPPSGRRCESDTGPRIALSDSYTETGTITLDVSLGLGSRGFECPRGI